MKTVHEAKKRTIRYTKQGGKINRNGDLYIKYNTKNVGNNIIMWCLCVSRNERGCCGNTTNEYYIQ